MDTDSLPYDTLFQSTLPCEERRLPVVRSCRPASFNPRSRVRSDRPLAALKASSKRFQSTLPRKERQCRA